MEPLLVGTMAMFEVIAPSSALSVETSGCDPPAGHSVRKFSAPSGTTVAFNTYASAVDGGAHVLPCTLTVFVDVNAVGRVSITRHGAAVYSESPPVAGGAK